uniref:CAP domain-containing protein n=1 Tax=Thaumasiovibrio occultus TaxID=1891184 RepID=UPI001863E577|nr:CAP domain-containing protein [Thaumasiovibrio occultus]
MPDTNRAPSRPSSNVPTRDAAIRHPAPSEFASAMLAAVNRTRARAQICGNTRMPAVPPLEWNGNLAKAAYSQSFDMAQGDFMSHTSSDGSTLSDRVDRTNYPWMAIGENVAAGQVSVEEVMADWMSSEGHCLNIMNEVFVQMGASIVQNPAGRYGTYWTQVFGVTM